MPNEGKVPGEELSGIRNIRKIGSDRRSTASGPGRLSSRPSFSATVARARAGSKKLPEDNEKGNKGGGGIINAALAASAFWQVVMFTGWMYFAQIIFAFITLGGFGAANYGQTQWFGLLNTFGITSGLGLAMVTTGMTVTLIIGIASFFIAATTLVMRQIDVKYGYSLIIMGLCVAFYLVPFLSLIPWVYVWCAYVAWGTAKG